MYNEIIIFKDRTDAGKKLVAKLERYKKHPNTIVLGLPRGGIVTAFEIAKGLNLPLDVIVIRKMGAPGNPELAIGAVDEKGEGPLNTDVIAGLHISKEYIEMERERQKNEAARRLTIFRGKRPPLHLKEKSVILVDDGLATGATMKAAIHSVKAKKAKKIIVAVPVGAPESLEDIKQEADEVIYLYAPPFFGAVSAFYENFSQTTDEEVIDLLNQRS